MDRLAGIFKSGRPPLFDPEKITADEFIKTYDAYCEQNGVRDEYKGLMVSQAIPESLLLWYAHNEYDVKSWSALKKWLKKVVPEQYSAKMKSSPGQTYMILAIEAMREERNRMQANPKPTTLVDVMFMVKFHFYSAGAVKYKTMPRSKQFLVISELYPSVVEETYHNIPSLRAQRQYIEGKKEWKSASDYQQVWDEFCFSVMRHAFDDADKMMEMFARNELLTLISKSGEFDVAPGAYTPAPVAEAQQQQPSRIDAVDDEDENEDDLEVEEDDYCIFCGADTHLVGECKILQRVVDYGALKKDGKQWVDNQGRSMHNYVPDYVMAGAEFNRYLMTFIDNKKESMTVEVAGENELELEQSAKPQRDTVPEQVKQQGLQGDVLEYKYQISPIDFLALSPDLCDEVVLSCDQIEDFFQYPFDLRRNLDNLIESKLEERINRALPQDAKKVQSSNAAATVAAPGHLATPAPQVSKASPKSTKAATTMPISAPTKPSSEPSTDAKKTSQQSSQGSTAPLVKIKTQNYTFQAVALNFKSRQNVISEDAAKRAGINVIGAAEVPHDDTWSGYTGIASFTIEIEHLKFAISAVVAKETKAELILGKAFKNQSRWSTVGDNVKISDPVMSSNSLVFSANLFLSL